MKTKEFYLKLKQKLVVLSIFVTSLFLMSSCSILGTALIDENENYKNFGYHFAANDSYGQRFAYQILNDNEVALVVPNNYDQYSSYKLPNNVIVPKTIKFKRKNYTVSAIYDKSIHDEGRPNKSKTVVVPVYEEGHSLAEYLEKSKASVDLEIKREKYKNGLWVPSPNGMVLCFRKIKNSNNEVELHDIVLEKGEVDSLIVPKTITDYDGNTYTVTSINGLSSTIRSKGYISQYRQTYVVLPETVKRFGTGSGIPREIICYSPDIEISVSMDERKDVFHFPQGHANKIMEKTTNPFPYVEIVDNYDIYQEGNSLKEYIAKSRAAVKKAKEDFAVAAQAALAAEKAAEEKKAAEWQAQQEAEAKRIRKELTRKYGANYMNAVQKGDLTIGMPKELVRYGLQNRLFKKFTSMDLDSQTATREVYDLYYTSLQTMLTYKVGWISFTNGKVSSIHWY